MDALFGASRWTSILGYAMAIAIEVDTFVKAGGFPTTVEGWAHAGFGLLIGIFGRVTKQSNVTHSPAPAQPAPVVDGQKQAFP